MNNGTGTSFLRHLGVYGYDAVESVVLAALVSEDPLLLIGRAGTGKTFLLNSLSEALGLEHRHYNASLISFDDLVGFPYPKEDGLSIRFIETPATVWQAESVLVDELNRCKPEHQNRFFSLVHERRLQGLKLERLRYRWAAMNPVSLDQGDSGIGYAGCEPLDYALADRFAFLLSVEDWGKLSDTDQRLVADPRGDGRFSSDNGALKSFISEAQVRYRAWLSDPCHRVVEYARLAANALAESGVALSPRRVRQLVKNILAVQAVSQAYQEKCFLLALRWSLPHRACGGAPEEALIHAAHRTAWIATCADDADRWLHGFHFEKQLAAKITSLLEHCPDSDTGTLAVTQLLANESKARAAAFALALYPFALVDQRLKVGAEGIQELGLVANQVLDVEGRRGWYDKNFSTTTSSAIHPEYDNYAKVFASLKGARQERAKQLFSYLWLQKIKVENPDKLEQEFNAAIKAVCQYQRNGG